jgi:hypothetical protein
LNHAIFCDNDSLQPSFEHISDGFYGDILQIQTNVKYAMDYFVKPIAQLGRLVECVAKFESGYGFYAKISVQSKNDSKTRDIWLNFQIGTSPSRPFSYTKDEWMVYVQPKQLEGDWALFNVNLKEAVENSIGKEGWGYRKLRGFRLRGNLQIAYIKVY